jgi:hypothetical protein
MLSGEHILTGMTKHDEIIGGLMDALGLILREAEKTDASRHYINGVAAQAMKNCDAQRVRNSDGYLVVAGAGR